MQSKSEGDQHRSTTTVDDLPDEVLELIFNLTDFQCALLCGRVCRRWLEVSSQNVAFMRKVQLTISKDKNNTELKTKMMRTYKLVSIEDVKFTGLNLVKKFLVLLSNCEKLELLYCGFKNTYFMAFMLAGCKHLKDLKIYGPELIDVGLDGVEAVDSCANNFAIDLELNLNKSCQWMVLQLFKMINLDISRLRILIGSTTHERLSDIAEMMDYVHENHRLAFQGFKLKLIDTTLPPLFIKQIKHLTYLSIFLRDETTAKQIDQISNNVKELEEFEILISGGALQVIPEKLTMLKSLPKLKFLDIYWYGYPYVESVNLPINELQQLQRLKVYCVDEKKFVLNFPGITRQHQLSSMKNLILQEFLITRNVLQLIFKTMPNLVSLYITNANKRSQTKRLARNKNGIHRLQHLETLQMDRFWVDENFLRNMKLPQLKSFTLHSSETNTVSFTELSNIGLLHLAKQCPKLMEIKVSNPDVSGVLIASRKTAGCIFTNHEDVSAEKMCKPKSLSEVFLDNEDEGDSSDGDGSSEYSEEDIEYLEEDSDEYEQYLSEDSDDYYYVDSDDPSANHPLMREY